MERQEKTLKEENPLYFSLSSIPLFDPLESLTILSRNEESWREERRIERLTNESGKHEQLNSLLRQ